MGARTTRRWPRRASSLTALLGLALGLAGVVGAAPAHAFTTCDPPACQPNAVNDQYSAVFGSTLKVQSAATGLLANDAGLANTQVAVNQSQTTTFNGGTVTYLQGGGLFNGTFTYKPPSGFSGIDVFTYALVDPNQVVSNTATVQVDVMPLVQDDSYSVAENHTLTVKAPGVFANDGGFDPTTLKADAKTARGVTVGLAQDGSFVYAPPHNFAGVDSFHYSVADKDGDGLVSAGTVQITVTAPPPAKPTGYWMVGATGIVYAFGQVHNYGDAPSNTVTHLEPTPSRKGYWVVNASGTVFAFGDARVFGGPPAMRAGEFVTSLSATPTGNGYWMFTNRGRAVARGDAQFLGDMRGVPLNGPVVGSVATPTGKGYYMVGSDGGIFSFGDARFHGSMGGIPLNKPVNGIVPTTTNGGYWLVASDGGVFSFGDARFRGGMGATPLNRPIIGMVRYGNGYLMVASDGGIFDFSNLPFVGSLGNAPPPEPIVGVGAGG